MFNHLKLKYKIGLGFAFILVLLCFAAFTGLSGLRESEQGFIKYRELARDTNLSSRVQANMLMVRMAVKNYLISHDEAFLADYQTRMAVMNRFLEEAQGEITHPERKALVVQTTDLLNTYQKVFKDVVALVQEEDRLYFEVLVKEGPVMREQIAALKALARSGDSLEKLALVGSVQESLLMGRLYLVRFMEKNVADDYQIALNALQKELEALLSPLQRLALTSTERAHLDAFLTARTHYLQAMQAMHTTLGERHQLVERRLDVIGPQVAERVEDLKLSVMAEQDQLGPYLQARNHKDLLQLVVVSVIAVLVGGCFAVFIARAIAQPLQKVVGFAHTLAEGDLSKTMQTYRRDEVGDLQNALSQTSGKLKAMVSEIYDASGQMSCSAEELAVLTEQARTGILQQQEETDQVASAVSQLAYTAQHVAENAAQAADAAELANDQVSSGRQKMQQATQGMHKLSGSLNQTADEVEQLQQKTRDINAILDVIKGIAEQTNLLALNAAIEAARAGEQGRGFAVVADEVRGLAQRTQQSTEMIHDLIGDLQRRANQAVDVMHRGQQEAEYCIELVDHSDQSLNAIRAAVERMNEVNTQIASAAEQQSVAAEQISSSISNVRVVAEQSCAAADETANASVSLSDVANQLQTMVQRFRLSA